MPNEILSGKERKKNVYIFSGIISVLQKFDIGWMALRTLKSLLILQFHISDEHPGCRGKRRPVVKKTYSTINVVNNSAPVAVGGKIANITGGLLNHPA